MNQHLSILTGCSAGATESFVVVPFELVKIKYVTSRHILPFPRSLCMKTARQEEYIFRPHGGAQAHSKARRFARAICGDGKYLLEVSFKLCAC
jgi:hypothetical protein